MNLSPDALLPTGCAWFGTLLLALVAGCAAPSETLEPPPYPSASAVPIGEARLYPIAPGVWTHVSTQRVPGFGVFSSNGLVVREGQKLWLVDTAWGEPATWALLRAIDRQIGLPVEGAVVTHFHDDRLAGADILAERHIPVYAAPLTHLLARAEGNAVPSDTLSGLGQPGDAVRLGPLEVFYGGAAHTRDNVVVYVPASRVVFGGCAVHEARRTGAGNTADADLGSWAETIRQVRHRYPDALWVVPGHGEPGGTDLLAHTIRIVETAER